MLKIKKILFPIDYSNCSKQAFDHAIHLAHRHKAELHLIHAIIFNPPMEPLSLNLGEVYDQLQKEAESFIEGAIADVRLSDIKVVKFIKPAISPLSLILDYAKGHDIDLIVLGTHCRGGLGRLVLGSVAETVIREAACPVLAVREQEKPKPADMVKIILLPIDFSQYSQPLIDYAKELAELYRARIQLLHVVEKPAFPALYKIEHLLSEETLLDIAAASKNELFNIMKESKLPADCELHVINGKADQSIAKFAQDHNCDLIVISTHGLTGLEHLLIGSVTEKVVRSAPCPMFIVKAFGKQLI